MFAASSPRASGHPPANAGASVSRWPLERLRRRPELSHSEWQRDRNPCPWEACENPVPNGRSSNNNKQHFMWTFREGGGRCKPPEAHHSGNRMTHVTARRELGRIKFRLCPRSWVTGPQGPSGTLLFLPTPTASLAIDGGGKGRRRSKRQTRPGRQTPA